ncbi:TonB-dependent receptor [Desulfococcaceae bacterium HSG8]|nr:TonB-dependent receptor [Desulfococcaceae bacterium HSG8]
MKTMKAIIRQLSVLFAFTVICAGSVFSQQDLSSEQRKADAEIDEEFAYLQEEAKVVFVVTASRVKEDIRKSASSITVITDEQIRQMGARSLADVLRAVPGVSVYNHPEGIYKIDIRGLSKNLGQDVLFMVNSHPLNNNYAGGAIQMHDTLTVENIKRIEVIRGPGSALYGANAFSGVINVITKGAEDIDGCEVSMGSGSYDTHQYNFMAGKTWNDLGIAFNLNHYHTDGFAPYIERDSQTASDQAFKQNFGIDTDASFAPGYPETDEEKEDVSLALQYKGIRFDGRYVGRERKPSTTVIGSLNKEGFDKLNSYYLNLGYEGKIGENLILAGKAYRNHDVYAGNYYRAMPRGAGVIQPDPPIGISPTIATEGLTGLLLNKNNRTGIEIQATYKMGSANTLVSGMTYEKMKQYDVEYRANFLYTPVQNVLIPLPSIQDLSEIQNVNKPASREFKAFFIQDLWDITENFRLTLGARYDDYSDFGSSFNPRFGVAWEFISGFDLKLIYGRAFRAPGFYELYSQNNPAVWGNPDLEPETVNTYEISLGTEMKGFSSRITGFHSTVEDSINTRLTPEGLYIFENTDEMRSQGVEAEMKYDFGKGSYLAMNYTYQDSENADTGEKFGLLPEHKGTVMANIRLSEYFNFYTNVHFQRGFERMAGDDREDPPDFEVVNTTLIAGNFLKGYDGLEIRASVYNLLDKEYVFYSGTLPDDLPAPGRHFVIEVRGRF